MPLARDMHVRLTFLIPALIFFVFSTCFAHLSSDEDGPVAGMKRQSDDIQMKLMHSKRNEAN